MSDEYRLDVLRRPIHVGDAQAVQAEGSLIDVAQAQAELFQAAHSSGLLLDQDFILCLDSSLERNLEVNRAQDQFLDEHRIMLCVNFEVEPRISLRSHKDVRIFLQGVKSLVPEMDPFSDRRLHC